MSGTVATPPQHALTLVAGLSPEMAMDRLRKVVWAAPRSDNGNLIGAPGLHDLRGTQRTMLVNDLTKFQIRARIRVVSAEALREVCRGAGVPFDPANPRIIVRGPTDASYVASDGTAPDAPWMDYEIGAEWREYPAIFASWLDYRRGEDRRLGASYVAMRRIEDFGPGGEKITRWQEYNVRAIDLFEFRLPGDDMGHAPLAIPGQDTRTSAEFAQLHAMIAQLQHQIAGLTGAPQPEPTVTTEPTSASAPVVWAGERVADEVPGPDDKFAMPGGAHLGADAYGDNTRQVGYDPGEEYQPGEDGGSEAELAAVVNATGGNQPKARRAQR